MCEICDAASKVQRLNEELAFRLNQYQYELMSDRFDDAAKAKERAENVLAEIFSVLDTIPRLKRMQEENCSRVN